MGWQPKMSRKSNLITLLAKCIIQELYWLTMCAAQHRSKVGWRIIMCIVHTSDNRQCPSSVYNKGLKSARSSCVSIIPQTMQCIIPAMLQMYMFLHSPSKSRQSSIEQYMTRWFILCHNNQICKSMANEIQNNNCYYYCADGRSWWIPAKWRKLFWWGMHSVVLIWTNCK